VVLDQALRQLRPPGDCLSQIVRSRKVSTDKSAYAEWLRLCYLIAQCYCGVLGWALTAGDPYGSTSHINDHLHGQTHNRCPRVLQLQLGLVVLGADHSYWPLYS
jgi:hypothetical protein